MPATLTILLFGEGQSIFDAASTQAEKINGLDNGFITAALSVLLLVIFLTVYISIKYRAKSNIDDEPAQINGNHTLEILMIAGPLVLVIVFFFWSVNTMSAVLPARGGQRPDVVITGHQWWWGATYPALNVTAANEIHLPVGKKILMVFHSADVIHDWWVPALGGKMDMIPGIENYLWVTITKPGVYDGTCSEFCGQQHAWMRIRVVAQMPDDYGRWLKENAVNASVPHGPLAQSGQSLFMHATCSNCHSIKGTMAEGTQGPDLTHFAGRQTMLAGLMANTPANVNNWITDPQKIKPGAHMPRFIFSKDSVNALTAYLTQLK
jgi:cytochrome c oxidase subunit 2